MYSLAQKRMLAKKGGEDFVVLTMAEVDAELAKDRELDDLLVKYQQYVPAEVLQAENEKMFGPKPDDSKRRCVHCNQFPDGPVACCDKWDGSFYWEDDNV